MVEEKKSESVGLKELLRNYIKLYSPLDYYLECIDNKVNPRTIHLAKRSFFHREIANFIKFYWSNNKTSYAPCNRTRYIMIIGIIIYIIITSKTYTIY